MMESTVILVDRECLELVVNLINKCKAIKLDIGEYEGKFYITKQEFKEVWYENIHIAIWNNKISIDAGFKEHRQISKAGKEKVDKNREILKEFKEKFLKHDFTFDPTDAPYSGFILYRKSKSDDILDLIMKILKIIKIMLEIFNSLQS